MEIKRKNRFIDKLNHLDKYSQLLLDWIPNDDVESLIKILSEKDLFAIYHAFQLSMESIADISAMISKELMNTAKDDYSNYEILFNNSIIEKTTYSQLKELNGLRNRITHDYNGIIDTIALEGIIYSSDLMEKFKEEIYKWLDNK